MSSTVGQESQVFKTYSRDQEGDKERETFPVSTAGLLSPTANPPFGVLRQPTNPQNNQNIGLAVRPVLGICSQAAGGDTCPWAPGSGAREPREDIVSLRTPKSGLAVG